MRRHKHSFKLGGPGRMKRSTPKVDDFMYTKEYEECTLKAYGGLRSITAVIRQLGYTSGLTH